MIKSNEIELGMVIEWDSEPHYVYTIRESVNDSFRSFRLTNLITLESIIRKIKIDVKPIGRLAETFVQDYIDYLNKIDSNLNHHDGISYRLTNNSNAIPNFWCFKTEENAQNQTFFSFDSMKYIVVDKTNPQYKIEIGYRIDDNDFFEMKEGSLYYRLKRAERLLKTVKNFS
jgi:hypothetical protein